MRMYLPFLSIKYHTFALCSAQQCHAPYFLQCHAERTISALAFSFSNSTLLPADVCPATLPCPTVRWIESVHGPCDKVVTSFRPVPLKWHYCLSPEQDTVSLLPLLDGRGRALNPALLPLSRRFLDASSDDDSGWKRWDAGADKPEKSRSAGTAGRDRGTTRRDRNAKGRGGAPGGVSMRTLEELVGDVDGGGNDPSWHRLPRWKRVPSMELVVGELQRREMLPAIWFIFSRKDCDAAAVKLPANGMCLTDANGECGCGLFERDLVFV
jgi:superfamily II RNA helicase